MSFGHREVEVLKGAGQEAQPAQQRQVLAPTAGRHRPGRRSEERRVGRPPEHDLRHIMDAILYVDRTGIPWRYLPHDFAPWETVYGHFAA